MYLRHVKKIMCKCLNVQFWSLGDLSSERWRQSPGFGLGLRLAWWKEGLRSSSQLRCQAKCHERLEDMNVVLLVIYGLGRNGKSCGWISSGWCLAFRKVVSSARLVATMFQEESSGFHKHLAMLKLHFLSLMDIVKLRLNSVTLPIWQRNHFNCRSVSRKWWSIYLSLHYKSVSWTTAAGTGWGFALVRRKWSSLGNKLIDCRWNQRIPPVVGFSFQFSSRCHALLKRIFYTRKRLNKSKNLK